MGDTTDQLLKLAKSISSQPYGRELDMLMSSGEQISISLLSMALKERGFSAVSLTGFQAGIQTKGDYTKNRIKEIEINKIKKHLDDNKIVVVAGFQGINDSGDITTLGRGGSDTSAVGLAAKLQCRCEIYTDVEGIFTIDPRVFPQAQKISQISYEEMLEMAGLGANVLEPRAVNLARKFNIPIYVASSQKQLNGTIIKERDLAMEEKSVTGITVNDDVLMVTINHIPNEINNISEIFKQLADQDINIDMISQTPPSAGNINISFTTTKDDLYFVKQVFNEIKDRIPQIEVSTEDKIVKLAVVGIGMRNQSGVAAKIFKIFSEHRIEINQITTSEISISYTINEKDKNKAINQLANEFDL